jgi:hypothetical protein
MMTFEMQLVFTGRHMINTKLAPILAMIRRSPYTTISNETVAKILGETSQDADSLKGLVEIPIVVSGYTLNTEPSLPDTITMHLAFMIYNYTSFLKSWVYLKQGVRRDSNGRETAFREDGVPIIEPALSAEHSNLYTQWCDSLIKSKDDISSFMFDGEVAPTEIGASKKTRAGIKNESSYTDLQTRVDIKDRAVLRNGDAVIKVGDSFPNTPTNVTIGYHVYELSDALNLDLGAYQSKRTGEWIWTKEDMRRDIVGFIKDEFDVTVDAKENVETLVVKYREYLEELPVYNVAFKYIKKVSITNTSYRVIDGMSLRRSVPLSVLPLVSSPVPTVQYLGGATTDISFSITSTSEDDVRKLTTIFAKVEESCRNKIHHSGSQLIYVESDLANLNGTFVITTKGINAQSVPSLPGTFVMNVSLSEQTEVSRSLVMPEQYSTERRKAIIKDILTYYKKWDSSKIMAGDRYIFDKQKPSYIETILIPSLVRVIRNGYLRYLKEQNFGVATPGEDFLSAADLMSIQPETSSNVMQVQDERRAVNLSQEMQIGIEYETSTGFWTTEKMLGSSRLTSFMNPIWKIVTGQLGHHELIATSARNNRVWTGLIRWLITLLPPGSEKDQHGQMVTNEQKQIMGAVEAINKSDSRRLALLLRSPKLLDWEQRIMAGEDVALFESSKTINADAQIDFDSYKKYEYLYPKDKDGKPSFDDKKAVEDFESKKILSCYPDLGIPFRYACVNSKGEQLYTYVNVKEDNTKVRVKMGNSSIMRLDGTPSPATSLTIDLIARVGGARTRLKQPTDYTVSGVKVSFTTVPSRSDYEIEINYSTRKPVTLLATNPAFYLADQTLLDSQETQKLLAEKPADINAKHDTLGFNSPVTIERIFGTTVVPSNVISNTWSTSGVNQFSASLSMEDPAGNKVSADQSQSDKSIKKAREDIDKLNASRRTTGDLSKVPQSPNISNIGTMKSLDDIVATPRIMGQLTAYGQETSDTVIAEAQLEHKIFKSTFRDYNADIEKSVGDIVAEARKDIYANPKYYSMDRAYPTYKLYFREENAPQWFLFDNFFDYRSLESIRFWREKASPVARCHIVLNDTNGTLTDIKALLAKESFNPETRNTNESLTDASGEKPMQTLFLTPGTQIQLKVGYATDPANLTTLFNGFITDVSPGEKYEIICDSYGLELLNDADMGMLTGWLCPPKAFIWMMLLDPKVKHLGTLFTPSTLPTGLSDWFDGPSFDDNIYINERHEPDKIRLFQAYNADGMKKWDVLQDIAAAHPGFICQTAVFDDRETVFFGRPDFNYAYTSDLGTVSYYPDLSNEEITKAMKAVAGDYLSGAAPQTAFGKSYVASSQSQDIANYNQNKENIENARKLLDEIGKDPSQVIGFNYMQWMPLQKAIDSTIQLYHDNLYNDYQNNTKAGVFELVKEYCRCVDQLSQLAADIQTHGNVEYDLFGGAMTPEAKKKRDERRRATMVTKPADISLFDVTEASNRARLDTEGTKVKGLDGRNQILDKRLAVLFDKLKVYAQQNGWVIELREGYRNKQDQEAALTAGYSNAIYGLSPHSYGLAFDIALLYNSSYYPGDEALPGEVATIFETLGDYAELSLGMTWGGRFSNLYDPPHFELKGWTSDKAYTDAKAMAKSARAEELKQAQASSKKKMDEITKQGKAEGDDKSNLDTATIEQGAGKIIEYNPEDYIRVARLEKEVNLLGLAEADYLPIVSAGESSLPWYDLLFDAGTSSVIKGSSVTSFVPLVFFQQDSDVCQLVYQGTGAWDSIKALSTGMDTGVVQGTPNLVDLQNAAKALEDNMNQQGSSDDRDKLLEQMRGAGASSKKAQFADTSKKLQVLKFWDTDSSDVVKATSNVYQKIGMQSPMVIYLWRRIHEILAKLKAISDLRNSETAQLSNLFEWQGKLKVAVANAYSSKTTEDLFMNDGSAGMVIDLGTPVFSIVDRPSDPHIAVRQATPSSKADIISFRGRISETDLQAHVALKNLLLTTLLNMDPRLQTMMAVAGRPPTKRRFRRYHVVTSYEHIVNNNIKATYANMWNKVKVMYKRHDLLLDYYIPILPTLIFGSKPSNQFNIQAGQTLDMRVVREITVPIENARTIGQARAYATSILAEGVRNMYTGTLTILGNPEIKPHDIVYVYDDYTNMYGPIEVKSVNHIMSAETGFITIIEPHAYVEPLGVSFSRLALIIDIIDTALIFWAAGKFVAGGVRAAWLIGREGWAKGSEILATRAAKEMGAKVATAEAATTELWAVASKNTTPIRRRALSKALRRNVNKLITDEKAEGVMKVAREKLQGPLGTVKAEERILETLKSARRLKTKNTPAPTKTIFEPPNKIEDFTGDEIREALQHLGVDQAVIQKLSRTSALETLGMAKDVVKRVAQNLGKDPKTAKLFHLGIMQKLMVLGLGLGVGYFYIFAGKDDKNYACPLKITPLSYKGSPYTAGLEGLTHKGGVMNMVKGELRRFWGSLQTVNQAFGSWWRNKTWTFEE